MSPRSVSSLKIGKDITLDEQSSLWKYSEVIDSLGVNRQAAGIWTRVQQIHYPTLSLHLSVLSVLSLASHLSVSGKKKNYLLRTLWNRGELKRLHSAHTAQTLKKSPFLFLFRVSDYMDLTAVDIVGKKCYHFIHAEDVEGIRQCHLDREYPRPRANALTPRPGPQAAADTLREGGRKT